MGFFKENFSETVLVCLSQMLGNNRNCNAFSIFRGVILLASSNNGKSMLLRQKNISKDLPLRIHSPASSYANLLAYSSVTELT